MNYQKKCLHITVFSVMEQNEYSFFFSNSHVQRCVLSLQWLNKDVVSLGGAK